MGRIASMARKLKLEDGGLYINHKCSCGADTRLGKDGDGITWSWCPQCKVKLVMVYIPRFPRGSLIKVEPHDD
jgi:hypothetical protein